MPRQQVYGKRSRAIYDPFAIFASPQRPATNLVNEVEVAQLVDQVEELKLYQDARDGRSGGRRLALGERDLNSVPTLPLLVEEKKKPTKRRQKRIIGEDEEQSGDENAHLQQTDVVVVEPRTYDLKTDIELIQEVVDQQGESIETVLDICSTTVAKQAHSKQDDIEDQLGELEEAEQTDAQTPVSIVLPSTSPKSDIYSLHCESLLSLSLHSLTSFSEWSGQLSNHFAITKIAEASFGEVYRLSLLEQIPGLSSSDESVFKVIALRQPESTLPTDKKKRTAALKKADGMSRPEDVANEVRLLQRMSSIPGFTNFRDVRILRGRPGQPFVQAYKAFNTSQKVKEKDPSIFPDPAKKASYSDNQLWAVIEMQDAGTDLERYTETEQCTSIWSVWDVFWQVVLSLAKGEEGAQFEHRDLHLGNICVRSPLATGSALDCKTIDAKKKLGFTSLETTIIDYTISRALMPDSTIAYHDLARDSGLFEGDSTEEYQYDIYRYMRGAALLSDGMADFSNPETVAAATAGGRSWEEYQPVTNLVWLHFVLYKLLEQLDWPSAVKAPPKKRKVEYALWKRANDLEHKLLKVQSLLDPEVLCRNELRSASDIVGLALTEGWLDVEDVMGDDGEADEGEAGDDVESELIEEFRELRVRVDVMEQYGLEVAEQEAKAGQQRSRRKK